VSIKREKRGEYWNLPRYLLSASARKEGRMLSIVMRRKGKGRIKSFRSGGRGTADTPRRRGHQMVTLVSFFKPPKEKKRIFRYTRRRERGEVVSSRGGKGSELVSERGTPDGISFYIIYALRKESTVPANQLKRTAGSPGKKGKKGSCDGRIEVPPHYTQRGKTWPAGGKRGSNYKGEKEEKWPSHLSCRGEDYLGIDILSSGDWGGRLLLRLIV